MQDHALRVLLVEDNTFTRATVRGALENAGLIVVGDTGVAAESLDLARTHKPTHSHSRDTVTPYRCP